MKSRPTRAALLLPFYSLSLMLLDFNIEKLIVVDPVVVVLNKSKVQSHYSGRACLEWVRGLNHVSVGGIVHDDLTH